MIVSDEVEMVMRAKIQQVLKFFYVELCRREMIKQLMKDCEGCEKDWPSQWDHTCCIINDDDFWTYYFDDAKSTIDLSLIREVCANLVKLVEVSSSSEWEDLVLSLPSMNTSVAMMIAGDVSFPDRHEKPMVNFLNNMCDVKED